MPHHLTRSPACPPNSCATPTHCCRRQHGGKEGERHAGLAWVRPGTEGHTAACVCVQTRYASCRPCSAPLHRYGAGESHSPCPSSPHSWAPTCGRACPSRTLSWRHVECRRAGCPPCIAMHSVDADSRGRACLSLKDWAASDAAAACLTPAQGAPWHASDALPPWLLQAMRAARRRASSAFSQRQLKLLGEGVQCEAAPRPASSKQAAEMQAAKRWGWDAGQARRLSGLGLMAAFSACGRHTEHQPNMLGMLLDAGVEPAQELLLYSCSTPCIAAPVRARRA